jgi:diphosphomevalonate decarboxylase
VKKADIIRTIFGKKDFHSPRHSSGSAFAPTNIALCKYWGKRNEELNLPLTSSLSISLGEKGASTYISLGNQEKDLVVLNDQTLDMNTIFCKRLIEFLDLFRVKSTPRFQIQIKTNIPIAAGLASSACGYASVVLALNNLYGWKLEHHQLSILARMGSGSASRSLWSGFVEWHVGIRDDGMDSHGMHIPEVWSDLCVGLLVLSEGEKCISSRDAMQRTVTTSALYSAWPAKVSRDLFSLKQAISVHDFQLLGKTAESNAMAMHATMLSAWPPVFYGIPETLLAMQKVWALRREGLPLYFTQDAGPNIKLLFLQNDIDAIKLHFPEVEIIQPFAVLPLEV